MLKRIRSMKDEGSLFLGCLSAVALIPLLPEYFAPVLAGVAMLLAIKDAHRRGTTVQIGPLGKLLLLYVGYMAIGICYSAHKMNSLATVAMWVVMFCLYLSLTTALCNRKRLHCALFFIAAAAGVAGFIACFQYLYRLVFGMNSLPNQFWYHLDEWFYRYFPIETNLNMGVDRAASTFTNPNMLAEYLVMVTPLAGYYGFCGKRTTPRLLARAFTVLAVFGVIMSFSRGAYLALLSMLLLIVVTHLRKLTPFMMCLIAAVSLIPEAIVGRFLSIGQGGHAIVERLDAWEVALEAISRSPLIGMGPGISNFWEFLLQMGVNVPHAHNLILQVLVEGGFIALFLLCLVATRLLQDSLSLLNRSRQAAPVGRIFLIFAVAFVVHGMVDYPFLSPKLVGTFCMVLGFFDTMSGFYLTQRLTPIKQLFNPLLKRLRRKKAL